MYTVIMAGGKGTRFWHLSTEDNPKQLLSLVSNTSLLQQTVSRITPLMPSDDIHAVLVCLVDRVQEVKDLVEKLENS